MPDPDPRDRPETPRDTSREPPAGPPDPVADDRRMKAVLVAAAAFAFAAAPLAVPFEGFDPARYPIPQEDPPVQPAGYAFSIWGPIYLWLIAHALFGLVRRADDPAWDATRWPLALSLAVGAPWLAVATRSPVWATAMIWVMLAAATLALLRTPPGQDRWLLRAPLALYTGWLTAASWVSLALLGAGWGVGPGALGWAWIALAGALAMTLGVAYLRPRAPFHGAAVAWALVAVAVANWGARPALVLAALAGAGIVLAAALVPRRA
jgi:hypothetical protein